MKYSTATLLLLLGSVSSLRIQSSPYESGAYIDGSPYSTGEHEELKKELAQAADKVEMNQLEKVVDNFKAKNQENAIAAAEFKEKEWNDDINNPAHIQGRKYEIVSSEFNPDAKK